MSDAKLKRLPLARVKPNPDQPRKTFDQVELEVLAASIKERGLLQPIKVRPVGNDFMLILGERRWRAHCLLHERGELPGGMVTALVQTMDETEMAVQAIIENLQRVDISLIEEARAFKAMLDRGFTVPELAKAVGTLEYRVREKLALLDLDEGVARLIETKQLAMTTASLLVGVPRHQQAEIVKRIAEGKLRPNTSDVRAAVGMVRQIEEQPDLMNLPPAATPEELDRVSRLEARVDQVVRMLDAGFKDGECVAAKRVNPDRVKTMADKLVLARQAVAKMERQLRDTLAQTEMLNPRRDK